jgi:MFS transporter, OPA family, glycerol-3-phosphate transporter
MSSLAALALLLFAIGVVVWRLPKVDVGHSDAYKRRRLMNWVPLGMTYAFLYFGRYNLSAIVDVLEQQQLLTKQQFGNIDGIGAWTYGIAFLINGPLTDLIGGRITILIAAAGSAAMNLAMGYFFAQAQAGALDSDQLLSTLTLLNAANMYFQSFGAVSIVKVNAPWFHVRERGVLGALFGILISLGLYFSYDWTKLLMANYGVVSVFAVPAAVLLVCFVIALIVIRDTPSKAGFVDFDTGDASAGETGHVPIKTVLKRMFSQRVIWLLIAIEFCSGFLRQGVMKWYRTYAKAVGEQDGFVYENWGLLLCVAGILGGVFAGLISDHVFQSRRGPVASVLYGGLVVGVLVGIASLGSPMMGVAVLLMSLCVIGVHGMLSGTASMDFGGSKHAGLVTGVIDGFVYLGTGCQAFLFGRILPRGDEAKNPEAWLTWPLAMLPVAVVGLLLCTRVWNARPQRAAPLPTTTASPS